MDTMEPFHELYNHTSVCEEENDGDVEDRTETARKAGCEIGISRSNTEHALDDASSGKARDLRASTTAQAMNGGRNSGDSSIMTESRSTSHSAVGDLGRSLRRLLGGGATGRCAVLILDHCESLLSTTKRGQTADRNNYFSQFLLLPTIFRLNLTVIAITHSTLLINSGT